MLHAPHTQVVVSDMKIIFRKDIDPDRICIVYSMLFSDLALALFMRQPFHKPNVLKPFHNLFFHDKTLSFFHVYPFIGNILDICKCT